jgi:hypothetical protein
LSIFRPELLVLFEQTELGIGLSSAAAACEFINQQQAETAIWGCSGNLLLEQFECLSGAILASQQASDTKEQFGPGTDALQLLPEAIKQFGRAVGLEQCIFDAVEQQPGLPVFGVKIAEECLVVSECFFRTSKFTFKIGGDESSLSLAVGVCV